jgi:hypothetical protein
MAKTASKKKARAKKGKDQHTEAALLIAKALRNRRSIPAALAHPIAGPIMKKLGQTGIKQLSAVAKNQSATVCDQHPSTG